MHSRISLGFLALLCLPVCATPTTRAAAPARDFGGWTTGCRSDGYCSTAARDGDAMVRIGRHARQIYWEVSFADPHKAAAPLTVTIDGRALTFAPPDDVAPYGTARDLYFLGRKAQMLMDRLVPGKRLAFDFADTAGAPRQAAFRLAGLAQALMWIDTTQHRIGAERVAEAPPYGLYRADVPGAAWMGPALAAAE